MKAKIEIEMENAAFAPHPHGELASILSQLSEAILDRGTFPIVGANWPLRDVNGNTVGKFEVLS